MAENNSTGFRQAYPPPPPWYKEFTDGRKIDPPPLPQSTYTCFGWPRLPPSLQKSGLAALPTLDSETALFSSTGDLRGEFRRLFKDLVSSYLTFMGQLSTLGDPSTGSISGTIQNIMRLHRNLQHILMLLRYWEAREKVVSQFRRQLEHKALLIEQLKETLSPFPRKIIEDLA